MSSSPKNPILRVWFPIAFILVLVFPAMAAVVSAAQQPKPPVALRVVTHDKDNKPVAGVKVDLLKDGTVLASLVSDENGVAEFTNLAPGTYDVGVSKEGLQTDVYPGVEVTGKETVNFPFEVFPKIVLKNEVTIKGESENQVEKGGAPVTEIQPNQAKATPLKPSTAADTLPLVPGIARKPTGQLAIFGSDENRSALIVNDVDATDPATGEFGVTVPVDVVQSINVFQTPYLAEYGRFTAGVVSVETKRGGDKWHFELNDPLPDFRIFSGHLRGIRDATPRVDFSGPLVPGKLFFSEGIEYALKKQPVKGLAFPNDESKTESVNSYTQIDYLLSSKNTLTGTFHLSPWHANFLNLDPFNPQPVTPSFSAHDYSGTVTERAVIGGGLLESILGIKRFTGNVWPQGNQDMVLTPDGNSGNYFSRQDRHATRTEWIETYSPGPIGIKGKHNLKIGSVITRTTNRGQFFASPVDIEDAQGNLIKRIQFVNSSPFDRRDLETTFFAEDHYVIRPNLSLDIGLRFERQGITETMKLAPRAGIAWAPKGPDSTIVRGGFGLFYDRVPLDVYSFASYPEQLVTTFAPNGQILTGPTLFANITDRALRSGNPFIRNGDTVGNFAPYSSTWNVEVDQPINRILRVRANYTQSNSSGVVIFTPEVVDGRSALVLGGGGRSTYRQFELVARLNISDRRQMFFSYVHSRSQGNVNQFNNYLGNFPFPVVRNDVYSNLPGDLPNRFLAWGVIHLPWAMRIAPLVEYRNGFPYAKVDAAQNFVGLPYTTRYPPFYSADARVSKDIKVNDKYSVRLSVSGFNITNHFNPSAVFSNVASNQFGTFFGNYKRHLTADFDVIF